MAFEIFLIYHSHIDIGYTERQEKVADYQADFLRQAVDCALSTKQDNRDEKAKFKYTAEAFWGVEQYLNKYGEEGKQRLIRAVKAGYIELSGTYLHLTELLDQNNLNRSLDYALDFKRANGIEDNSVAMSADVNGYSWAYAEALYRHGVRYFSTNINVHHGGVPFGKPNVPFYWRTHEGNRILTWNGFAYHRANVLGMIPGQTPKVDPGIPGMLVDGEGYVEVKHPDDYMYNRISDMLRSFQEQGYPYEFAPVMGSGCYTDNSPVFDGHCELIEEWNKKYSDIAVIRTGTLKEFFKYLEKQVPNIPEYAGDWNDWWTDGVASTPLELHLFRNAQRRQRQIRAFDNENVISEQEHNELSQQLILYAEHTWGHSASHSDPCKLLVSQLDLRKGALAVKADILAESAWDKLCKHFGEAEFTPRKPFHYIALNPTEEEVSACVYLPIDQWEEGYCANGIRIYDSVGREYSYQRTSVPRGLALAISVVLEPHEHRKFYLSFIQEDSSKPYSGLDRAGKRFENDYYILTYAGDGIESIYHKCNGKELLQNSEYHLGQPVYQIFPQGVRWEAAGSGYTSRKKPDMRICQGEIQSFEVCEEGCVFVKFVAEYKVEGAEYVRVFYTCYHDLSKIEITVQTAKQLVSDPEGMYVALPVGTMEAEWYLDKPDTFIKAGSGLPNTCCDYFPVQRGAVAMDDEGGVVVSTLDSPLVTIGSIKLWDFTTDIEPKGCLFSWITNNKWETNFRGHCAGFLEDRYIIEPFVGKDAAKLLSEHDLGVMTIRTE